MDHELTPRDKKMTKRIIIRTRNGGLDADDLDSDYMPGHSANRYSGSGLAALQELKNKVIKQAAEARAKKADREDK